MHRLHRRLLTPLVLIASLSITGLSWQHERHNAMRDQQAALDFALRSDASRIEQGMAGYQQMLRGAQGLFAAAGGVEPHEFRAYVDALQLDANFSGIDGIGFLPLVTEAERDAHVAAMRKRGFSDYTIRPAGVRGRYAPLVQLEPTASGPLPLRGFDAYADSRRRPAMELARDTDAPVITRKLSSGPGASGRSDFVMYLPLYRKDAAHDTLASRRANLIGWVSASFRMSKLMASLYGERHSAATIRIYDGIELLPQALLYATAPLAAGSAVDTAAERLEYIEIGGRTWSLEISAPAASDLPLDKNRSQLIALAGASLSLLLAALTWSLVSSRERAYALATNMTAALRASEARYRHLAQHDVLTSLPNLALFSDRLQQALTLARRNHTRLAVLFLDLDQFKPINDALGHHIGDLLLQAVAKRLQECVRASDTVARIGGDEFVLLLSDINDRHEALALAELIRDALDQPFAMADGQNLEISSSIGVAIYPEHGSEGAQLLKHADQAMYGAKRRGRNQVRSFEPGAAA